MVNLKSYRGGERWRGFLQQMGWSRISEGKPSCSSTKRGVKTWSADENNKEDANVQW